MADAPAAVAPAPAPAAQAAPAVAAKPEPKPFLFDFAPAQNKWGIDGFLLNQYLEGTVKFSEKLHATYRTLSVEQTQYVEAAPDITNSKMSVKYLTNELTIAQIYHSLQAVNGTPIPAVPVDFGTSAYKSEADPRRKWIRQLPGVMFDMFTKGLTEFERRAKESISPEALKNF